jgi:histidinol-phosphate aminotransferase
MSSEIIKDCKQPLLKLDFNERCDNINPLVKEFSYGENLWQYPDRLPLENSLAKLNKLSANQVLCTNGGDEAIMILMRLIKERSLIDGVKLILPLPAFSQYTWGIKSWSLDSIAIPATEQFAINFESTLAAIKLNEKAITILTRPNNPTGESIPISDLIELISASKKANGWVFLDEAYIEFSEELSAVDTLLSQFDNCVILRTFSKAYGLAGVRLGYILGSEAVIEEFKQRCMPFNIPAPSLQIAMQALTDKSQNEMRDYCKVIRSNRNLIVKYLEKMRVQVFPSHANFVLLKLPANQAQAIKSFMAKNNILVRSFNEGELKNCLRITIPFNTERLIRMLEQCFSPKLVCMDMDGVLIDTSGSYDQCVIETVKQLSGKDISNNALESLRKLGGYNNDWVLSQQLLIDLGIDSSLEKVTAVFQGLYLGDSNKLGLVNNETVLISDNLIKKINQSNDTVFSIVTGRPRKEAKSGQAMINLQTLDLISLDDVKEGKPSPEGIQKLQSQYSKSSWMCGDNPDDMQAAVESDSLAIGIGSNKIDALYEAGADIVLNNINELEQWVCLK